MELSHIILALLAYGIFGITFMQACVLAVQMQWLHKTPSQKLLNALPPQEMMQRLMFYAMLVGFIMLSAAIVLGFIFFEQGGQLYLSKSGLSILAWCIYFVLLVAHYKFGLKLRLGVYWTILAWVGLSLAYFGTRFL